MCGNSLSAPREVRKLGSLISYQRHTGPIQTIHYFYKISSSGGQTLKRKEKGETKKKHCMKKIPVIAKIYGTTIEFILIVHY